MFPPRDLTKISSTKILPDTGKRWYSFCDELPWQNYKQCKFFGYETARHIIVLCPRLVFCRTDCWCCVLERSEEVTYRTSGRLRMEDGGEGFVPFSHSERRCVQSNKDAYVVARRQDVISKWRASIIGAISGACPT